MTASGSAFPLGATNVTCTATDAPGNTGSTTFVVTVVKGTPPEIADPAQKTVEATGS
ncbi:MAG TPA: HYR domain-containing protein [Vicinamibacterales bacterium]|nr:HYR domain-containing protein [Vicinamibacterales bacterium]